MTKPMVPADVLDEPVEGNGMMTAGCSRKVKVFFFSIRIFCQ